VNTRRYLITIAATAALAIGVARVAADTPIAPTVAMPAREAVPPAGEMERPFTTESGAPENLSWAEPVEIPPEK
jgi:hypothetical protein